MSGNSEVNLHVLAMDNTKPLESQESEAAETSSSSFCLKGNELTINALDMTNLKLVLSNNRTTVVGDNSQLNICPERCRRQQRVSQSKSAQSGVPTDGKGASSQIESTKDSKRKRRKRKKSGSKVLTTEVDGNSADGENSDSDNADKFGEFLQCDSDD